MDCSLARTEFEKDIIRTVADSGHYHYVNKHDKLEYNGIIFGEICCAAFGTKLSAQGTHFAGRTGSNEVRLSSPQVMQTHSLINTSASKTHDGQ
jgi:hypothetical protein